MRYQGHRLREKNAARRAGGRSLLVSAGASQTLSSLGRLSRADDRACARELLALNGVAENVRELGPAPAKVLWCQGCLLGCKGCMSPETWDPLGGVRATPAAVAQWLISSPGTNLTVSGGEPSDQAMALVELFEHLGAAWLITIYSGHTIQELRADTRAGVLDLLDRADVLIDGRYEIEQHDELLWRGSRNQRIHNLTGRVDIPRTERCAGVTVQIASDGTLHTIGVPPARGYVSALRGAAKTHGVLLDPCTPETSLFPFPIVEA